MMKKIIDRKIKKVFVTKSIHLLVFWVGLWIREAINACEDIIAGSNTVDVSLTAAFNANFDALILQQVVRANAANLVQIWSWNACSCCTWCDLCWHTFPSLTRCDFCWLHNLLRHSATSAILCLVESQEQLLSSVPLKSTAFFAYNSEPFCWKLQKTMSMNIERVFNT